MDNDSPRICVIGAGCSGLAAIKNLADAGFGKIVCYEQNPWIGGNWKYTSESSHSSVCSTTHIISSKKLSEYRDFPMPEDYPDYPSHEQVLAYFESYAEKFGLKNYIRFNSKVAHIEKEGDGWIVELESGAKENFDYLMVANGHHSVPNHPEFKDAFKGEYMHSHDFKNNSGFEGKRVLVIGAGNSGCDCAVEISRAADHVAMSLRTAQYIVPKFFLGKPADSFAESTLWLPNFVRNFLLKLSLRFQVGKYSDYGLPDPQHGVLEAHPTMNSELLYKIRHGKVHPHAGIKEVNGTTVRFNDGSQEDFDVMVAATGYKIETAFFDKDFIDYSESDRVELYLRMIHPDHPTLFFIGLFQPQGAIWPGSDLQSNLAAGIIKGTVKLPSNIRELASRESDEIDKRYLKRKRHTIEVDYHEFMGRLRKQLA